MHVYIYDSFLGHKKYNNILARIETRLTDLGLNGKICRLGVMKNIANTVENELKRGVKTIIAVGNDHTVAQVINAMAHLEDIKQNHNTVPLGIIPIGDNNQIAKNMGINTYEDSCDVLSARRVEKIDLGQVNNSFFITKASITSVDTTIKMDKSYSVEITDKGDVNIVNMQTDESLVPQNAKFDPQDGVLDLFIKTKKKKTFLKLFDQEVGYSVFPIKKILITNTKNRPLVLDGCINVLTPAQINIFKGKINVIVGKNRTF